MEVTLRPGDTLKISFADDEDNSVDGDLILEYGEEHISINTEWPDDQQRMNEIYYVSWGRQFVLHHRDSDCFWWGGKVPVIPDIDSESAEDWVSGPPAQEMTRFTENEKNFLELTQNLPNGVHWQEIDPQFNFIASPEETVAGPLD